MDKPSRLEDPTSLEGIGKVSIQIGKFILARISEGVTAWIL
jgi:hypothetical protein